MHNKKGSGLLLVAVIVALASLCAFGLYYAYDHGVFSGLLSSGGSSNSQKVVSNIWTDNIVNYQILASNKFTGNNVDPSVYLYQERPESCWDNPRASCDEVADGTYSSSSGVVTINKEKPGHYYIRAVLSGYYTQFFEIDIRNGPQSATQTLSDYNAHPDTYALKMEQADTLTITNQTFSVSANTTGKEYTITQTLSVSDNKCWQPWKFAVYENNYSLTDKGSSVSFDGIKELKIYVEGKPYTIIDLNSGTKNGFSTDGANQNYEVDLESRKIDICDGNAVTMKYYIKANTLLDGNLTTIENGDELLASNEVIAKLLFYDRMGTKAPSTGYLYLKGDSA